MTDPNLLGFGHPDPVCAPSCFTQIDALPGPGTHRLQRDGGLPPGEKISVSVAVTYLPAAFDTEGNYANSADALVRSIGGVVAPNDPPPTVPGG
jgi:hypothetical protein